MHTKLTLNSQDVKEAIDYWLKATKGFTVQGAVRFENHAGDRPGEADVSFITCEVASYSDPDRHR